MRFYTEASWAFPNINSNWELRIQIWYNFEPDLWMPPPHPIRSQCWNLGHPYIIPPKQATSLPCNPFKGLCPYPSHLHQAILGYEKLQSPRESGHKTPTPRYRCGLVREERARSSRRGIHIQQLLSKVRNKSTQMSWTQTSFPAPVLPTRFDPSLIQPPGINEA